jgi:hypothetical protein
MSAELKDWRRENKIASTSSMVFFLVMTVVLIAMLVAARIDVQQGPVKVGIEDQKIQCLAGYVFPRGETTQVLDELGHGIRCVIAEVK